MPLLLQTTSQGQVFENPRIWVRGVADPATYYGKKAIKKFKHEGHEDTEADLAFVFT